VRRGDVLVVARLDRLARSLSHLLSVIAELDAKGAHFKSLADPIDTTTPQGRFALQVLGAVAELERALIQERTKDGLRAAKKRGRVGGNPNYAPAIADAIKQIVDAKAQAYFERVNRTAEHWLPIVKDMRPDHRWQDVVRVLNAKRDRSNAGESGEGKSCRDEACEEFVVQAAVLRLMRCESFPGALRSDFAPCVLPSRSWPAHFRCAPGSRRRETPCP